MKVLIMRGISGSGKSTYANNIAKQSDKAIICSADNFWIDDVGNYNFDRNRLSEAHAWCYAHFVGTLTTNYHDIVIVDNTNTQLSEIAPYIAHANYHNADIEIVRCVCPHEEAAKRNVHGVPAKTVESMQKRMQSLPRHWPKETIVETDLPFLQRLTNECEVIQPLKLTNKCDQCDHWDCCSDCTELTGEEIVPAGFDSKLCWDIHKELDRLETGLSAQYKITKGKIEISNCWSRFGPYDAVLLLECLESIKGDKTDEDIIRTIKMNFGGSPF